jgi:hypothetical protein
MIDTHIACAILIAAHIFFMPLCFLACIMSSALQTGNFKEDYLAAFKAYHLICFVTGGLAFCVYGVFWSLEVLLK